MDNEVYRRKRRIREGESTPSAGHESDSINRLLVSIEGALEANLRCQVDVKNRLNVLANQKAENRRKAAAAIALLTQRWQHMDSESVPAVESFDPNDKQLHTELKMANNSAIKKRKLVYGDFANTLLFNDRRRWKALFFADPIGTEPVPNGDTRKRYKTMENGFFYHQQPPLSKKEAKALSSLLSKAKEETGQRDEKFWRDAADHLASVASKDTQKPPLMLPRTTKQIMALASSLEEQTVNLSKKDSARLVENGALLRESSGSGTNWEQVASMVGLSPWQCLKKFHQDLKRSKADWTIEEDRILLSAMAAHGPQHVLDFAAAHELHHLLHGTKSSKSAIQIQTRLNQSLLNPNFKNDKWTRTDQQRLVIGRKVYDNNPQGLSSTLMTSYNHFPDRSATSVQAKWSKSLDPSNARNKAFTAEEDALLESLVREADQEGDPLRWASWAKRHFKDRHPDQLLLRCRRLLSTASQVVSFAPEPSTTNANASEASSNSC